MYAFLATLLVISVSATGTPTLPQMISLGTATVEMVQQAFANGGIDEQQAGQMLATIAACPNGVLHNTIPRFTTPIKNGQIGYGSKLHGPDDFEPEYLGCCQEPIQSGNPDFTGMYEVTREQAPGIKGYVRIEQCGNRILFSGAGVVHDFPSIDSNTVITDVTSLCVGLPGSFYDNGDPVSVFQMIGQGPQSCEQLINFGTDGCSCKIKELSVRVKASDSNCYEGYTADLPDSPEVQWCKQDNGDIIRTKFAYDSEGEKHEVEHLLFTANWDDGDDDVAECPPAAQAALDAGLATLEQLMAMMSAQGGDVSGLQACVVSP